MVIYWERISTPPRQPHPDKAVEALMQAAWEDGGREPLNAHDDAERIVEIVRAALV